MTNYIGAVCILLGLSSVIGAVVCVLLENNSTRRALATGLATVPDHAGRIPGEARAATGAAPTDEPRRLA